MSEMENKIESLKRLEHKVIGYINNLIAVKKFIDVVKRYYNDEHLVNSMFFDYNLFKDLDTLEKKKNEKRTNFENKLDAFCSKIEAKVITIQDIQEMNVIAEVIDSKFAEFFEGEMFFHGEKRVRTKYYDGIRY